MPSLMFPISGIGGVALCAIVVMCCHHFDIIHSSAQEINSLTVLNRRNTNKYDHYSYYVMKHLNITLNKKNSNVDG